MESNASFSSSIAADKNEILIRIFFIGTHTSIVILRKSNSKRLENKNKRSPHFISFTCGAECARVADGLRKKETRNE